MRSFVAMMGCLALTGVASGCGGASDTTGEGPDRASRTAASTAAGPAAGVPVYADAETLPDPCAVFDSKDDAAVLITLGLENIPHHSENIGRKSSFCVWNRSAASSPQLDITTIGYKDDSGAPEDWIRHMEYAYKISAECDTSAKSSQDLGVTPSWDSGCIGVVEETYITLLVRRGNVEVEVTYKGLEIPNEAERRACFQTARVVLSKIRWLKA